MWSLPCRLKCWKEPRELLMLVSIIEVIYKTSVFLTESAKKNVVLFETLVIHQVRPHVGQRRVAERLRSLLHSSMYPSEIAGKQRVVEKGDVIWCFVLRKEYVEVWTLNEVTTARWTKHLASLLCLYLLSESHRFCNRVQDSYTLRCCPQVSDFSNTCTGTATIKKPCQNNLINQTDLSLVARSSWQASEIRPEKFHTGLTYWLLLSQRWISSRKYRPIRDATDLYSVTSSEWNVSGRSHLAEDCRAIGGKLSMRKQKSVQPKEDYFKHKLLSDKKPQHKNAFSKKSLVKMLARFGLFIQILRYISYEIICFWSTSFSAYL